MLRFPLAGRYAPQPQPDKPKETSRYRHELTVKWPNPTGAKRPKRWHLPYAGRLEIGQHHRCPIQIPGFTWSHFLLILQDGMNDHGIQLHLIEDMRATIASPLGVHHFGPKDFGTAEWSMFQQYWKVQLPEKCCGRILIAHTEILFQRNNFPYRHLPPSP